MNYVYNLQLKFYPVIVGDAMRITPILWIHILPNVQEMIRDFIDINLIDYIYKSALKRKGRINELHFTHTPMLTQAELDSHDENSKKIHSKRFGASYTVMIKKFNQNIGAQSYQVRNEMKGDSYLTKKWNPDSQRVRPYFKQYNALRFILINKLPDGIVWHVISYDMKAPKILTPPKARVNNLTVINQF